jgi:hypothetical protein
MLGKYYSLDECLDVQVILEKLDSLTDDGKIYYSFIESDVIKIKDGGLTPKETKDLITFFEKNDLIEYLDYEDIYEDFDEEDEDNEFEEDDFDY